MGCIYFETRYIYIYICVCIYMCVCVYVCIYIYIAWDISTVLYFFNIFFKILEIISFYRPYNLLAHLYMAEKKN